MKSKYLIRGIIGLIVLYAIGAGIMRQIHIGRLAEQLRAGSQEEKMAAARDLMKRDRLYDKVQEMKPEERITAAQAVKSIGGEQAVRQLLGLLKDADANVRTQVTAALSEIGGEHIAVLIPSLKDSDANVSAGASNALIAIGPKVIPQVQTAAKDGSLRGPAMNVLIKIGPPSVPAVIDLLDEDDQDLRMAAADALGKIGSKDATPALLKSTGDIAAVRRVAVSSLCAICDPRSTDLLVEVLSQTRDDGEVRARAARALSVIGGGRAISALVGALGDMDQKVRTSVITGIQRLGDPAVGPVVAAIAGGSSTVRHAGAAALEKIDSTSASAALLKLSKDSDPVVRISAARGLGEQRSNPQTSALISMLSDSDGRVADAAVLSLAGQGSSAVSPLISVISNAGQAEVVKFRAATALAKIGADAAPSLKQVASSGGPASVWAVFALGQAGDRSARDIIAKLASSSNPEIKWTAERALQRL